MGGAVARNSFEPALCVGDIGTGDERQGIAIHGLGVKASNGTVFQRAPPLTNVPEQAVQAAPVSALP